MAKNSNLHTAKTAKNDEFYTRVEDIEKECNNYREQFKGKVIYCNCDNPAVSNFFKYFAVNFKLFGLKKLICTCYGEANSSKKEYTLWDDPKNELDTLCPHKKAYKIIIPDAMHGLTTYQDVYQLIQNDIESGEFKYVSFLDGDGDFRSEECVELLKESDIVVTNPPFSLFREFIALLEKYKKKYLVLSNMNAITYKEIFPLIHNNKIWAGYGFNLSMIFKTPYKNTLTANVEYVRNHGLDPDEGYVKVPGIVWFTNLDTRKRHEELFLYKKYNPIDYPTYDNYNAIEVDKVENIPEDYDGVMGVPITFLNKYNPDQFELIGHEHDLTGDGGENVSHGQFEINGKGVYKRILIHRKK